MIVFVVLDGLRPDQITSSQTPNLYSMAQRGVRFLKHHSVFPTHTRVNVTSMFTGRYPGGHGIIANSMFFPAIDPTWRVSTGDHLALRKLGNRLRGPLVTAPSLGEVLQREGRKMAAVGVGSSGNAYLHHHRVEYVGGAVIHPDFTTPEALAGRLTARFGPWPATQVPNAPRMERGVTVLLDHVLPDLKPDVAALWLSDPDSAQHKTAVGSPEALAGLRTADEQLGRIVAHLESEGLAHTTDVMVASDHGHSTVGEVVDVAGWMVQAGLKADMNSTDVLVAENGGCASVYVPGSDGDKVRTIIQGLMSQQWCGPLFVRDDLDDVPGALPMSAISLDHPRAPDVLFSFAWSDAANANGVSGTVYSAGTVGKGRGDHGSISPYEVHNVLVAVGPHFKRGVESEVPSSNADVFPTVLSLLGIQPPARLDGRVLDEAVVGSPEPSEVSVDSQTLFAETEVEGRRYAQRVSISRVGNTRYVDEGRVL